jgi:hypothetical protein
LFQLRQPVPFHQGLSSTQEIIPRANIQPEQQGQGQEADGTSPPGKGELPEGAPMMMGTFSINHQPVIILFDSGATHSFISSKCGTKVGLDFYPTQGAYIIATPGGKISSNQIYRKALIELGSNMIKTDILLLNLEGMDVLLGMDWMTRHRVSLDIFS